MKEKEIRVLKISPCEHPQEHTLENTLEAMQAAVGGYIEIVWLEDEVCLLLNEEGKLLGLEANRKLGGEVFNGMIYVCGSDEEGNLTSLTEDAMEYYSKMFYEPLTQRQEEGLDKRIFEVYIIGF